MNTDTDPGPVQTPPQLNPAAVPKDMPAAKASVKPEQMAEKSANLLDRSIGDAYTLLNFACRQSVQLDPSSSRVIIDSHSLKQAHKPLSSAEENTFWAAFTTVIDRVKPVTVESIVYTTVKENRPFFGRFRGAISPGERALRRHLAVAILTLAALLALQVEWAIGTAIYNDAYKVHGYYKKAQATLTEAKGLKAAVKGTSAEAQAIIALQQAQTQFDQDTSWRDVSYVRLWWWNRQIAALLPPYDLNVMTDGPADSAGDVHLNAEGKRGIEFTRAELTLQITSNYFLVTLFAMLGAITQALRTLSQKMAAVALSSNEVFRGVTRIILGVISGVCMAWLYIISTENSAPTGHTRAPLDVMSFLGAFAPWALAFISGYSVEIFFTALERFITIVIAKIKGLTPLPGDPKPIPTESSDQTSIK